MITIKRNSYHVYEEFKSGFSPKIFKDLSPNFLKTISDNSIINNYEANHMLIRQGDMPSYVYIIIKGSLRTLRANRNGDETTIRLLKEGDTCMVAIITSTDEPSPISVQVLKDSKVLLIPTNFIQDSIKKNIQFSSNLMEIITDNYKTALNQIDGISIKSPVQRVGYYLLEEYLEHDNLHLNFQLPFKKSLIASHLNMTPETFSRALSQIKKMGIDVRGENIILQDTFKLCNFCDLDSEYICNKNNKDKCSAKCPSNSYNTEKSACTG